MTTLIDMTDVTSTAQLVAHHGAALHTPHTAPHPVTAPHHKHNPSTVETHLENSVADSAITILRNHFLTRVADHTTRGYLMLDDTQQTTILAHTPHGDIYRLEGAVLEGADGPLVIDFRTAAIEDIITALEGRPHYDRVCVLAELACLIAGSWPRPLYSSVLDRVITLLNNELDDDQPTAA